MDDSAIIGYVLIWAIGFGTISAIVASNKGLDSTSWFVIGAIFGIFGLLAALVTQLNGGSSSSNIVAQTRKCPYCAEFVKPEAVVCRYCGKDLEPITPSEVLQARLDSLRKAEERGEGKFTVVDERSDTEVWVRWTARGSSALFSIKILEDGSLEQKRL